MLTRGVHACTPRGVHRGVQMRGIVRGSWWARNPMVAPFQFLPATHMNSPGLIPWVFHLGGVPSNVMWHGSARSLDLVMAAKRVVQELGRVSTAVVPTGSLNAIGCRILGIGDGNGESLPSVVRQALDDISDDPVVTDSNLVHIEPTGFGAQFVGSAARVNEPAGRLPDPGIGCVDGEVFSALSGEIDPKMSSPELNVPSAQACSR